MSRTVQQTSLISYRDLQPSLCDKQQDVLLAISGNPDCTDREIAYFMGVSDPNVVRPRRFELVELGYVVNSGRRVCRVSHKLALSWRIS